jgi:hypothetical protein
MANGKRKLKNLKNSCAWGCGRLLKGNQTVCDECQAVEVERDELRRQEANENTESKSKKRSEVDEHQSR